LANICRSYEENKTIPLFRSQCMYILYYVCTLDMNHYSKTAQTESSALYFATDDNKTTVLIEIYYIKMLKCLNKHDKQQKTSNCF